ncbi:hypothetical protein TSAR_013649 [Trichomalopsis sarcophagae]|uniref:Ubiquitin-like protease family profile domain-containing protein n=1 Tax=Trichomalopsis sarcophagae TaxID=543379 RepID=A0A232EEJ5_9HYME|nr:hypothetical protein TSAR_013649 [Trichomalopsis sarcophagae]
MQSSMNLKKFCNNLINHENYYFLSKSSRATVARYTMRDLEFSTLRQGIWINGIVINSFVATHIDEWIDFTYVPSDDSITIAGDHSHERVNRNKYISRTTKRMKNNLLLPYLYCSHWRLLHVQRKIMLLDPYGTDPDQDRAVKAFKNFTEFCTPDSSVSKLKNIQRVTEEVINRPYQPHDDGHSCGSYVMYYLLCIGSGKSFDMNFNPSTFRNELAYRLLLKSDNMESICLNCSATTLNEAYLKCILCKRKCREACIFKAQIDTDDEEKILKNKLVKRDDVNYDVGSKLIDSIGVNTIHLASN